MSDASEWVERRLEEFRDSYRDMLPYPLEAILNDLLAGSFGVRSLMEEAYEAGRSCAKQEKEA